MQLFPKVFYGIQIRTIQDNSTLFFLKPGTGFMQWSSIILKNKGLYGLLEWVRQCSVVQNVNVQHSTDSFQH